MDSVLNRGATVPWIHSSHFTQSTASKDIKDLILGRAVNDSTVTPQPFEGCFRFKRKKSKILTFKNGGCHNVISESIKQENNNKALLYSTENYIQSPATAHEGR